MKKDVRAQLKSLKHKAVKPSETWVKKNRDVLMSQISASRPTKVSLPLQRRLSSALAIFMPETMVLATARTVATFLIAAVVAPSLYYGTVMASQGALPGEGLYEAKRYTEQIQVTVVGLIGSPSAETQLHVELAKRRADETSQIIKDPSRISKVAPTVQELQNEITTINTQLDSVNSKTMSANVAKDVKQNTDQIADTLKTVKNSLLTTRTPENKILADQVKETSNMAQDVSVKAVEVLVTKHLQGDQTVSKDEIKDVINSSAQVTVDKAAQTKVSIDGVKSVLENAKAEVKDLAGLSIDPTVVSTTKEISNQINSVISKTDDAAKQTDEASAVAVQAASEVKQLLGDDNLTQAVDKIKQLTQVNQQLENISDITLEQSNPLLPIAQVVKEVIGSSASSTGYDSSSVMNVVSGSLNILGPSSSLFAGLTSSISTTPAVGASTTTKTSTTTASSTKSNTSASSTTSVTSSTSSTNGN